MEIAKKYLIPKSLKKTGLKKKDVKYKKSALTAIAEGYAREAGVRNFEKALDKIHRKLAFKIVQESEKQNGNGRNGAFSIGKENIEEYLGKPHFREDEIKTVSKPGMAIGLAWTPFGGDTLLIEAVSNPGKEGFKLTGQMGTVMQESAGIAYTYIRHLGPQFNIPKEFFEENQIHLHIPAGATPKDGPSAGITMATSLLTLAMDRKMKKNIAMTGELSLTGHVLPIGGLKEKIVAAKRNKVKEIIIPEKNLSDLEEIPDYIKKGITFHPVNTMEMVIEKIF
jgi:ATP-dependent Lon protease